MMGWLALYYLSSVVSALLSQDPWHSLKECREGYVLLLLPLSFYYLPKIALPRLQLLLSGMLSYLTLWGWAAWFISGQKGRIHGGVSHYMTFTGLLVILILLHTTTLWELPKGKIKTAGFILLGIALTALAFTLTRNGWVGLGVASLGAFVLTRQKHWLILPVGLLGFTLLIPSTRQRLASITDLSDPTSRDRLAMWWAGWDFFRHNPFVGIGPGMVKPLYPWYVKPIAVRHRVPHLHSNPIQISAERGLAGLIAYGGFIFSALTLAYRFRHTWEGQAAFTALLGITTAGFFEYNFGDTEVLLLTLVVTCLPLRAMSTP